MTETTTTPSDTIESYLRFWNAPPEEQRRLGADLFADDVAYVTPIGVRSGVAELAAFTEQFADGVGAYELRARTEPDAHHDRARVPWEILVRGHSFAEGTDVLVTDETGRVTSITSFVDRAPEGFDPHAHHEGPR